jgi:hypothetical protein
MMSLQLKWIRLKGSTQANPMSCTVYLCRPYFNPFAFGTTAILRIMESDHEFALLFLKLQAAADYSQRKVSLAGDELNNCDAALSIS